MAAAKYRILIVDDEPMIRNLLVEILKGKEFICDQASDGVEALEKMKETKYDAVVADVMMPKMDGIALTHEVRKRTPDLPVMLMTGFSNVTYRTLPINEEALNAGANEFITKPFSPAEFLARLNNMLAIEDISSQMNAKRREIAR